ncbi:response regulator transcription factor, partial [Slackia sp.]|uniref:response regulator transcription factor n=1 Tax=Slackia sp. TaxID=2049041 RepID=UPI002E774D20
MSDQSLKKRRILLVDDEPELRRMVAAMLAAEGFSHVVQAANVQEALAAYRQAKPELALLDVMLPDGDGFTLCQYLRAFDPDTPLPVIFLTAKDETDDRLAGLRCGADDYVTKPFSPSELVARVDAVYRRVAQFSQAAEPNFSEELRSGAFALNLRNRSFTKNGRPIELTQVEFQIMEYFISNAGKALKRIDILKHVWGSGYVGEEKIVDVNIRRLRMKIED